jgi:hypothetical protein
VVLLEVSSLEPSAPPPPAMPPALVALPSVELVVLVVVAVAAVPPLPVVFTVFVPVEVDPLLDDSESSLPQAAKSVTLERAAKSEAV